jgi:hypothetical protein
MAIALASVARAWRWLVAIIQFRQRAHERAMERESALREHTLELLDTVMQRTNAQSAQLADAMVEQAKASAAHAAALQVWFEMFRAQANDPTTTATVRPADEYAAEQQREADRLAALGFPIHASPEDQLAWIVANDA